MKTITSGAVAGFAGTTAMTLAMLSLEKVGLAPGKPPPKEITENLQKKLGIRDWLPKPVAEGSWIIALRVRGHLWRSLCRRSGGAQPR